MIPPLPTPSTVVDGITYALRMAIRQGEPGQLEPTNRAIWDALWFRFFLIFANSIVMLGMDHAWLIPLLGVIALVDTLSFPVISHFVLQLTGLTGRFPLFILATTWIGNLRVIILFLMLMILGSDSLGGNFLLLVVAIWMIWAAWSVATRSLGQGGFAGAGMVILMMVVEVMNASVIIGMIHPLVANTP